MFVMFTLFVWCLVLDTLNILTHSILSLPLSSQNDLFPIYGTFNDAALFIFDCALVVAATTIVLLLLLLLLLFLLLCDGKHISSMPILFASKNLFIGCG